MNFQGKHKGIITLPILMQGTASIHTGPSATLSVGGGAGPHEPTLLHSGHDHSEVEHDDDGDEDVSETHNLGRRARARRVGHSVESDGNDWDDNVEATLRSLAIYVNAKRVMHEMTAQYYHWWHVIIGVPMVVLSTLTSTSSWSGYAVSTTESDVGYRLSSNIQLGVAIMSLLGVALSGVYAFIGFKSEAEAHKVMSAKYATMGHKIWSQLSLSRHRRMPVATLNKVLQTSQQALILSPHIVPPHIQNQVSSMLETGTIIDPFSLGFDTISNSRPVAGVGTASASNATRQTIPFLNLIHAQS